MNALPPEELLVHTLDLLEYRLQRLEYVFNGGDPDSKLPKGTTAAARLTKLQSALAQLAARSRTVEQLLKLQSQQPELFKATSEPEDHTTNDDHAPDDDQKLALVLSDAPTFLSTASQLRALQDITIPPTTSFTHLVSQSPRFGAITATQDAQAREIADLRQRSALLVTRWYEIHVLGLRRCWADWEERMRGVERGVRRVEVGREVD